MRMLNLSAAADGCSTSSAAHLTAWVRPCKRMRACQRGMMSVKAETSSMGLSYKDAGVDIDAGNELVKRIQKMNPSIGGFSGLVPFGK